MLFNFNKSVKPKIKRKYIKTACDIKIYSNS